MGTLFDELRDIVGKIIWSCPDPINQYQIRIVYGDNQHLVNAQCLLDICNDHNLENNKDEIFMKYQGCDLNKISNIVGEVHFFDEFQNVFGSFELKNEIDFNHDDIYESKYFFRNLRMVDGHLPYLLTNIIGITKEFSISKISALCDILCLKNPLNLKEDWIKVTYRYKISRLLYLFSAGMKDCESWNGIVPNGGIIFDWDQECTGINYFFQSQLMEYLFERSYINIQENHCYLTVNYD